MGRECAIFEHRNGKTFLKRNDREEFQEVEVRRLKKGLRVVPVRKQQELFESTTQNFKKNN